MEGSTPDVGKIVALLTENPALLAEIRGLLASATASGGAGADAIPEAAIPQRIETEPPAAETAAAATSAGAASAGATSAGATSAGGEGRGGGSGGLLASFFGGERLMNDRREHLLRALKPYLSEGRGSAIDTAIGLAKILDTVRAK